MRKLLLVLAVALIGVAPLAAQSGARSRAITAERIAERKHVAVRAAERRAEVRRAERRRAERRIEARRTAKRRAQAIHARKIADRRRARRPGPHAV